MKLPKSLQDMLNQSEKALLDSLSVKKIEKLSAQQLKRLQVKSRRLHKKYSDLVRKQSRSLKNSAVKSANSNLRTLKKVDILSDVIKFVEKHLHLKTTKPIKRKTTATKKVSKTIKKPRVARKKSIK